MPLCSCSAPQQRGCARRVHLAALGREHPDGGRVHVAEQHPLDAALHERDPAAGVAPGGAGVTTGRRRGGAPSGTRGARASERAQPCQGSRRSRVARRAGDAGEQRHQRAQPARVGEQREDRRAGSRRSRRGAGRCAPAAGGPARSAGRTARRTGTRSRRPCSPGTGRSGSASRRETVAALLVADPHQHDAAARRVHLLVERPRSSGTSAGRIHSGRSP